MAETLIFEDDIGTAYVELLSFYAVLISPPPFSLTIGEKYKVVWDGQSYDVEAVDGSAVGSEVVMGNGTPFDLDDNDEPFAVVYTSNAGVIFAALTDTASTVHTVAVYHVTEDEPSVDPDDATVVLAEQTLTFDGTDPLAIELSSPLVVGQTYRVMWDGTAYTSTAADLDGVVFIGNAAFSGLDGASDTGEPFAIAYFDGECAILTLDAGDHTVAIYQEVEDVHASNDAVILSYSQNPVEYKAVPKVWLTHPDSTEEAPVLVPFTYGELLEGVEIIPDFKEGDMQISVPDGSLVKEATIIKPEDLTPENIRKGVTIGGIEGEFLGDTEEIEVELDMVDGDQVILPSEDGKVISKAIVAKPDALAPENIRFGVNLAGIEGKYTGAEAEEVAVDLDFSEGDMVIAPEEDKVFSTVKIPKPDTLIPENIAKGVDIAGIVGTLAAGSGGPESGIYLTFATTPGKGNNRLFGFNGEIYVLSYIISKSKLIIYKFSDGIFSECASISSGSMITDVTYLSIVEFNGLVHFLGNGSSYSKAHTVWDGNTFTAKSTMPGYIDTPIGTVAAVYNGELYASLSGKKLYKWDETTDTWAAVTSTKSDNDPILVCNGSLYCYYTSGRTLYQLVDGKFTNGFTLDSTVANYSTEMIAAAGEWIYMWNYNTGLCWKLNVSSYEVVEIGYTYGYTSSSSCAVQIARSIYGGHTSGGVSIIHGVIE